MAWVVVLIGLVFALLTATPHKTEGDVPEEDGGEQDQHALRGMDKA